MAASDSAYRDRFNRDLHLGAGLLFGVWIWGSLFSLALLLSFVDLAAHLLSEGGLLSADYGDAEVLWAASLGVLGIVWKLFASKHAEVEAWADERGVTGRSDLLREARKSDGLLRTGVWFWGGALTIVAAAVMGALALGLAEPAFGRAAAPLVAALGLVWQVFMGALVDRRRSAIVRMPPS